MTTVVDRSRGGLPWLEVRGERTAAFRALGEHARAAVQATVEVLMAPNGAGYRRAEAGDPVLRATAAASRQAFPASWAELEALAEGAAVPLPALLALNLRGDLGDGDGTGCSDLVHLGPAGAFLAHNEDGLPGLAEHGTLLTLAVAGETPVTVWWYPGFLPANTFTLTGHGLAFGIDHLPVRRPAAAAGRAFVARAAQQQPSVAAAADCLRTTPSAGGFAYTIGSFAVRAASVVEAAAGHAIVRQLPDGDGGAALSWHTNHARWLPEGVCGATADSLSRGDILAAAPRPGPITALGLHRLLTTPRPEGVLAEGITDPNVTLCSFVADLAGGTVLVHPRGIPGPITLDATELPISRR